MEGTGDHNSAKYTQTNGGVQVHDDGKFRFWKTKCNGKDRNSNMESEVGWLCMLLHEKRSNDDDDNKEKRWKNKKKKKKRETTVERVQR